MTCHFAAIKVLFSVEATVRGYHVYKDIWANVVSEDDGSRVDPFAVALHGQRGGHRWPRSEEDVIRLLSLSSSWRSGTCGTSHCFDHLY